MKKINHNLFLPAPGSETSLICHSECNDYKPLIYLGLCYPEAERSEESLCYLFSLICGNRVISWTLRRRSISPTYPALLEISWF